MKVTACEVCSLRATHTYKDKRGLAHTTCKHYAKKDSLKKSKAVGVPLLKTYQPLIIANAAVLLYVAIRAYAGGRTGFHEHLNDIMGGYFLVFGILQVFSGKPFAKTFRKYDPLAMKFPHYARFYPYLLIFFALMHHVQKLLIPIAFATLILFSIQTFGIVRALKSDAKLDCACIGTKFTFPLSWITVAENALMLLLAFVSLCIYFLA